ncbi:MAG: amino acid adenylation domain-containing protein [Duganella sp.]
MNDIDDALLALLMDDEEVQETDKCDGLRPGLAVGAAAPLTFGQHQLWILQQLDPALTSYNMVRAFEIRGALDSAVLEAALQALVARHAALRTSFAERDGAVVQVVQTSAPLRLELEPAGALDVQLARLAHHVFDLGAAPLLFARLYRVAPAHHVLVLGMHHIISDGWSNELLLGDLARSYAAGGKALPPAPALSYADYAAWQRQGMPGADLEQQLAYWDGYLRDVPPLSLPAPRRSRDAVERRRFTLPPALTAALQAYCRSEQCTAFVACLAAWQVLLGRVSGQRDFAVGVPNAGRNRAELQQIVGFFVTMQVHRAQLQPQQSWSSLCRQLRSGTLAALANADVPLELLLQRDGSTGTGVGKARQAGRHPLFQAMFGLEVPAPDHALAFGALEINALPLDAGGSKAELSLDVIAGGPEWHCILEYDSRRFDDSDIAALESQYLQLLQTMAASPHAPIGDAPVLNAAQLQQLRKLGEHPLPVLDYAAFPQTFEQQVRQTPDAPALLHDGELLTYAQLNRRANQLAHCLMVHAAALPAHGTELRIGIALPRSVMLVVGVLAILKSGAAYVALDPDYPSERLAAMVEDSAISLLLTTSALAPGLPAVRQILAADQLPLDAYAEDNPPTAIHPRQLAYIIYTSGSTGRPKGIGVEHHALTDHTRVAARYFGLTPDDRVLLFSTINFDGFVEQLFPALSMGAAVVVRGPELWDSARFYREIKQQRISVADLSTAYWLLLAQDFAEHNQNNGDNARDYAPLRQVHATGEAMPPEGMAAWGRAGLQGVKLLNSYGPTETIVTASVYDCHPCVSGAEALPAATPIGRPLAGRHFHVLDGDLQPVAIGAAGELCIGGSLLARAYLNRPGLSAERFIADPDPASVPGARLYRTGDLVRWREDGQLVYLGRIDQQVKVRGFRIELGEVETALLRQPQLRQAAVIAEAGQLLAYVVCAEGATITEAALKAALARALPDYMVPSRIVTLARLPLSPAGKIDRAALPRPQHGGMAFYQAPQGATESALAAIWCAILKVEQVGRHDDFFALGGNSLLALRLLREVQQRHGDSALALADIFNTPQLAPLAQRVASRQALLSEVVHLNRTGEQLPLYCFPGLNVNSSEYAALVTALGRQRPVQSFVSHALTAARWQGWSIKELAAGYAAHIRADAAGRPCILLGWSFGGDLAHATARELARLQQPVALVCMVDVFEAEALVAGQLSEQDRARAEALLASWLERSTMAHHWSALFQRMSDYERNAALAHLLQQSSLPLDGPEPGSGEYSLWVAFDNAMAMHRYRYELLEAPLHAFLAQASLQQQTPRLRDWRRHAGNTGQTVVKDVDHRTILQDAAFQLALVHRLAQLAGPP